MYGTSNVMPFSSLLMVDFINSLMNLNIMSGALPFVTLLAFIAS
jgi:hypothetical protein